MQSQSKQPKQPTVTAAFEHPQSQSMQPRSGQGELVNPSTTELNRKIDRLIATHTHNGNQSPRINANTDIIGRLSNLNYGAQVTSGGTAGSTLPLGWSVTRSSTGVYSITHTLGTTNYGAVATPSSGGGTITVSLTSQTSSGFAFTFYNLTASGSTVIATATNVSFSFVVST